ncbi:hypothetical protein J6590_003695 [Homalodisca vitripennis]|nr:hypothetical protein J6590_003695 [Homalodisca vitripennis]
MNREGVKNSVIKPSSVLLIRDILHESTVEPQGHAAGSWKTDRQTDAQENKQRRNFVNALTDEEKSSRNLGFADAQPTPIERYSPSPT